jgi:hypothetical protein
LQNLPGCNSEARSARFFYWLLFIVPDILRQFFLAFAESKGIVNNKVILAIERFAIHILGYLYLIVFKGETT